MKRVVVGVDGSPASLDVLRWAASVAQRAGLGLTAVRAWAPDQADAEPDLYAKLHAEAQRELEGWCAAVHPAVTPRTVIVEGDPAQELLAMDGDHTGDLLAVGPRGGGGFAHLRLGSVTHHLIHHTTVPLAVVPRPASGMDVSHIVVGTDGSAGSTAAVKFCAELAAALGVPVTAVHARDPLFEWVPESDPRAWRRDAERRVREWTAPLVAAGITVEIMIDRDIHPVAALARAAEARPGSIAVIGARGLGGFTGLRLGRVPLQLVHHTDAAVIVVPARQDAPSDAATPAAT